MATAHVLVVDDEEELRDVVCTLLRRAGHQATGAGDGRVVEPRQRGVEHDLVREGPSHQVKVCVGDLRRKLAAQTDPAPIEPVRGFGYRHRAA